MKRMMVAALTLIVTFPALADGVVFATEDDLNAFDSLVIQTRDKENKGQRIGQRVDKTDPKAIREQVLAMTRDEKKKASSERERNERATNPGNAANSSSLRSQGGASGRSSSGAGANPADRIPGAGRANGRGKNK